jgi:hypothetical protein
MKNRIPKLALVALCATALAVPAAKAITYPLSLGVPNSGISAYTGPYATVDVTLNNSGEAKITFTALTSPVGGFQFRFGGDGMVGVNVNASSFNVTGLTAPDVLSFGAGNEDGFGDFNLSFKNFDGFTYSLTSVSFLLDTASGTWGSASDVLTGNDLGNLAAAHIYIANPDGSNTGATGYAANGGGTPAVPDGGSTVALLGCSLAGIGMISRKFRKS